MSTVPEIVVSYGHGGDTTCVGIGVVPSLELGDEQVDEATGKLYSLLRGAFRLPTESRLTLYETETGRILSKETFRDPSFVSNFPRYWYLTAGGNGYATAPQSHAFQSLSIEDSTFPSTEYSGLSDMLIEGYSPPDLQQIGFGDEEDEELRDMYPSLVELSMGQGSSQEMDEAGSREDLTLLTLTCNKNGEFGAVFRLFTVIANILNSDQSSSEGGDDSRSPSRSSAHSSESLYTTLNMSTLFVSSVSPGEAAEVAGVQQGDIIHSINGQSVSGYVTDEIIAIIEESSKNLLLSVSPEKHDDLLFLYPQYINEPPGDYDRGSNEKIVISDIEVKTLNVVSPPVDDDINKGVESPMTETMPLGKLDLCLDRTSTKHIRPSSADYNSYKTTIDSVNNVHSLDVTSPLDGGSSEQSLSSGIEYNSSIEDLLIRGSLADIPVQPSPVQSRKFKENEPSSTKISSLTLPGKVNESGSQASRGSQNWFNDETNGNVQWFPKAADEFTSSLPVTMTTGTGSSNNEMTCEEFPSAFIDPPSLGSKKSKLALKLKKTFKNLTGTSSNGHPKLVKTSSLGIVKTNSTSAIDRLRVNSISNTALSNRSRSTDLGKIRLKRSSLEALTKVSSEESVVKQRKDVLKKQSSCGDRNDEICTMPPALTMEGQQLVPTFDFVTASPSDNNLGDKTSTVILVNSQGSSGEQYQLTPELGKNLSGDSVSSGTGQRGGSRLGGRSYRSQRQRLHQTKNPRIGDDKDQFTSSLVMTSNSSPTAKNHTPVSHRRYSRESSEGVSPLMSKKPPARRLSSWQNRNSYNKLTNDSYSSQDRIYNFSVEEEGSEMTPPANRAMKNLAVDDRHSVAQPHAQLVRSRSANETEDDRFVKSNDRCTSSSNLRDHPSSNQHQPVRPHSSGGKNSTRKAIMSVHPNSTNVQSGSLSYDPRGFDESLNNRGPLRATSNQQPDKFTSVFHGPIHKKQEKDIGGKKASDRSWRPMYAAIQKHRMVFYASVTDALSNRPLLTESPLDLHQCMVKVMPNGYKNRKSVFRLSSVMDASECVIQSENEESMMTWMRIIHNLNRMMRIRMGPPQIGMSQPHQRHSTQEEVPKVERRKLHRILTPQPPSKKKSQDNSKDDPSKRQQLLERLKRGKRKKEVVEDIEVPCYNTFGKPLEDCPASYENKSIPLVVMVCVKKLEKGWLDTEGLYRIAGPIGQVRTLAHELNKGHFNLLQDHEDPHVITAIMKKFLKELPDPLVPHDKYDEFISCAQLTDLQEKTAKMKDLVDSLPICHYYTLGFLVKHLTNIAAQHQISKMNQHNLAIVFGPTVAHKAGGDVVVSEMNAAIGIIKLLMNNLESFFTKIDFTVFYEEENASHSSVGGKNNRPPFVKGKSDSSAVPSFNNEYYGARSQSPRKSWDGTCLNSLSRGNLTLYSQEAYLSNYEGNSQDLRSRGPHKRRLASSRGKLTNIQEPDKDFDMVSPKSVSAINLHNSKSPSPIVNTSSSVSSTNISPTRKTSSTSSANVSPNRKTSYVHAVNKATWDSPPSTTSTSDLLQSVDEEGDKTSSHTEFPFTTHRNPSHHQNSNRYDRKVSTDAVYSQRTSRTAKSYSDVHHRRWSSIEQPQTSDKVNNDIEIFGPTSSTSTEWIHRNRRYDQYQQPVTSLLKGPESCL